ncbi:hypothetical protein PPRY_a4019 [Pseudoalteromonas prydzensis ACAM 620]|nr:hypothetical protein [Pseudoalteromonas prydzensis ACAM 620]
MLKVINSLPIKYTSLFFLYCIQILTFKLNKNKAAQWRLYHSIYLSQHPLSVKNYF